MAVMVSSFYRLVLVFSATFAFAAVKAFRSVSGRQQTLAFKLSKDFLCAPLRLCGERF